MKKWDDLPRRHEVRYESASGAAYRLILSRVVFLDDEEPPEVAIEHSDGSIGTGGGRSFASLDEMAREYGCTIVDFVSIELN